VHHAYQLKAVLQERLQTFRYNSVVLHEEDLKRHPAISPAIVPDAGAGMASLAPGQSMAQNLLICGYDQKT
jgi:hypothetical protein